MLDNLGPTAIINPLKCSLAALSCADPAMQTQPPNPHPALRFGYLLRQVPFGVSQEGNGKRKEDLCFLNQLWPLTATASTY